MLHEDSSQPAREPPTMVKRRGSKSIAVRRLVLLSSKFIVSLCVLLCLFAFLRLHFQFKPQGSIFTFRRRSPPLAAAHHLFEGPPKMAFLFLVRREIPLDFLWHRFFQTGEEEKFSIFIHSAPGFVFDKSTTNSSFFYGRQLNNSIQVVWGESTMIEAERLLLKEALTNPANQRFVLLSDTCVPLHSFKYIYRYITFSQKSFVDSFLNLEENRYNDAMSPTIKKDKWRKGSQWITLIRKHALVVVDDNSVLPLFRKFCKRWPPAESIIEGQETITEIDEKTLEYIQNCIPDEHYVQTLLATKGFEKELEARTLTYSVWNQTAMRREIRSWHPITFDYADVTSQTITKIKALTYVVYESEHRIEWCNISFKYIPCFLFARKFTRDVAARLIDKGLFDSSDDLFLNQNLA